MKNTRDAIKEALKGCDRLKVAKCMNITIGSLNNMVAGEKPYEPKGSTLNFVDKVCCFVDEVEAQTGRLTLLEWIAEQYSCVLIRNPSVEAHNTHLIKEISEIMRDFADIIDEIAKANNDQLISKEEGEKIREKWETMKRQTESFVLACETGIYAEADRKC